MQGIEGKSKPQTNLGLRAQGSASDLGLPRSRRRGVWDLGESHLLQCLAVVRHGPSEDARLQEVTALPLEGAPHSL